MIELKYSKKFHDGLRLGRIGNAAGIYPIEQFEAEDKIQWNINEEGTYLRIVCQHDETYSITVYDPDQNRSYLLDGASIQDHDGVELGKIKKARLHELRRSNLVNGFRVVIGENIHISVT